MPAAIIASVIIPASVSEPAKIAFVFADASDELKSKVTMRNFFMFVSYLLLLVTLALVRRPWRKGMLAFGWIQPDKALTTLTKS